MLNDPSARFTYRVLLQNTEHTAFGLDVFFRDFADIAFYSQPMLFNDCVSSCRALLTRVNNLANGTSKTGAVFAIGVETHPLISGIESISGEWDPVDVMKWWIYDTACTTQLIPLAKGVISISMTSPRITN